MTRRRRAIAAVVVCALHLALLAPTVGEWSSIVVNDFAPQADAIEHGDLPYRDQAIEYPPLSLPVLVAPAYFGNGTQSFVDAFEWEMLAFDLAIVVLVALALPGDLRRVAGALGVYTAGILILSGVLLSPSVIDEAPLALSRFDLVPALLVLAAVLARDRGRSGTWSALLALGAATKAFPLLLFPALLRGEQRLRRVAIAAGVPIVLCMLAVLVSGDELSSAVEYQTDRAVQIEALAATPFEVGHQLGGSADSVPGHGGFELAAGGADLARWLSILAGLGLYLLLVFRGWRSEVSNLALISALLAVMVVFSPVLSPQFLLWLLPVSACAYGLRAQNAVLLLAFVLTQITLQHYDQGIGQFGAAFVWPLAARNVTLLGYLALVSAPVLRGVTGSTSSG